MLPEASIRPVSGARLAEKLAPRPSQSPVFELFSRIGLSGALMAAPGDQRGTTARMESPHGPVSTRAGQLHSMRRSKKFGEYGPTKDLCSAGGA